VTTWRQKLAAIRRGGEPTASAAPSTAAAVMALGVAAATPTQEQNGRMAEFRERENKRKWTMNEDQGTKVSAAVAGVWQRQLPHL
jgi:hypothetical protein